jgi:sugar phosphate isomerase/epimerase
MYTNLSMGSLGLKADYPSAVDLAVKHGFDAVDGNLGWFEELGDPARITDAAGEIRGKGLRLGPAGCPVNFNADPVTFGQQLGALPEKIAVLTAADIDSVRTWVRPMSDVLPYRRNWIRHAERISLVAQVLGESGIRLGLEYVGPKSFWSTEMHPFVHTLAEARALIADTGCDNVGVVLDAFHWYTAHEGVSDLLSLRPSDIVETDLNDAPEGLQIDEQQDLDRRLPGTTGVIDTPSMVAALKEIGYEGPVKVEPFMKSLAERDVDEVLAEVSAGLREALA